MSSESNSQPAPVIRCRQCEVTNHQPRKFCRDCGAELWTQCADCDSAVAIDERFCGSCGVNLEQVRHQLSDEFEASIGQVDELVQDGRLGEAIDLARSVLKNSPNVLAKEKARLAASLASMQEQHNLATERTQQVIAQAEEALANHRYQEAIDALSHANSRSRNKQVRDLQRRAQDSLVELKRLEAIIDQAAQSKKTIGLLPKLHQYLAISPNDKSKRELAEAIAAQLCGYAKRKMEAGRLNDARAAIERILPFVVSQPIEKVKAEIENRCWLVKNLKLASHVDRNLIDTAVRIEKLNIDDPTVRQQLQDVQQRWKRARTMPRPEAPNWHMPQVPYEPHGSWSRTADFLPWLTAFEGARNIGDEGGLSACRFAVAAGLALQAIERASIATDLSTSKRRNWTVAIKRLRKKSHLAGWGLHVGASSLKAIRLEHDGSSVNPTITNAVFIKYPRALDRMSAGIERNSAIRDAMVRFAGQGFNASESVVMACSPIAVLSRFDEMPLADEKTQADLVEREAAQQIPFDMSEVNWSHHLSPPPSGKKSCRLTLVAARKHEIDELMLAAQSAGIREATIQSDALALHNLCVHFRKAVERPDQLRESGDAILLIQIGSESMHVIVSRPDSVWFRHVPVGSARMTRSIAIGLKTDFEQAESIKHQPVRCLDIQSVYRSIDEPIRQVLSEIDRSIKLARRSDDIGLIQNAFLVGGGSQLHGLIRALRLGPDSLLVGTTGRSRRRPSTAPEIDTERAVESCRSVEASSMAQ